MPAQNPFWRTIVENGKEKMIPKEGVNYNPLYFWCPPNGTSPDYACSHCVLNFLGYGFIRSWLDEDFMLWREVESSDIQELREMFLVAFEWMVLSLYDGDITERWEYEGEGNFDTVGYDIDNDLTLLQWRPFRIDFDSGDGSISLALTCTDSDDEVIWLALDALQDKRWVRTAVEYARRINGKEFCTKWYRDRVDKEWDKLGIPNVLPMYDDYLVGCHAKSIKPLSLQHWYKNTFPYPEETGMKWEIPVANES